MAGAIEVALRAAFAAGQRAAPQQGGDSDGRQVAKELRAAGCDTAAVYVEAQITALVCQQARIAALEAALRKYGSHPADCGLKIGRVCNCEFGALLRSQGEGG